MNGDVQVRFCERLGAKYPRSTRLSDTEKGANASAAIYSVIESAKANGHEPYYYLRYVIARLPAAKTLEDYEALLPYRVTVESTLI